VSLPPASWPTTAASLTAQWQCLRDDFESCIAHLRFPVTHRRGDANHEFARASVRPDAFGERAARVLAAAGCNFSPLLRGFVELLLARPLGAQASSNRRREQNLQMRSSVPLYREAMAYAYSNLRIKLVFIRSRRDAEVRG
jgi:hypothetical protein